jgi:hypothetical protein
MKVAPLRVGQIPSDGEAPDADHPLTLVQADHPDAVDLTPPADTRRADQQGPTIRQAPTPLYRSHSRTRLWILPDGYHQPCCGAAPSVSICT